METPKIEDRKSRQRINNLLESLEGLNLRESQIFLELANATTKEMLSIVELKTEIKTDIPEFQDLIKKYYENWLYT